MGKLGWTKPWIRWDEGEIVRLINMWRLGWSMTRIGEILNRPRGSIAGKIDRLGLGLTKEQKRYRQARGGVEKRRYL